MNAFADRDDADWTEFESWFDDVCVEPNDEELIEQYMRYKQLLAFREAQAALLRSLELQTRPMKGE